MKKMYVSALFQKSDGERVELLGWVSSKRCQGRVIFLNVSDSTGTIQVVVSADTVTPEDFKTAKHLLPEAGVHICGAILHSVKRGNIEIAAGSLTMMGSVSKQFSPQPRSRIDIFDDALGAHLFTNRHIYLRNPKVMAILKFRDCMMHRVREWFHTHEFISIDAPILTPVPLYHDGTAIGVTVHNQNVFLTQCVGYYLEAAVHAFEKVFNIGPSFRGEESRSKRHLMEYWHIKAEVAWANLEDIIMLVESIVMHLCTQCRNAMEEVSTVLGIPNRLNGLSAPFPRITYEKAIAVLEKKKFAFEFGRSMGSEEEAALSEEFSGQPFWICGIPRDIEPFPYVIDPVNPQITRVADLIASNGYGELLGTAEKISDLRMLDERMKDKGKNGDPRFEFVRDIHQLGCVPHAAFGMGVERMIRWMLNIPHVRDAIPFPRTFRRKIAP